MSRQRFVYDSLHCMMFAWICLNNDGKVVSKQCSVYDAPHYMMYAWMCLNTDGEVARRQCFIYDALHCAMYAWMYHPAAKWTCKVDVKSDAQIDVQSERTK